MMINAVPTAMYRWARGLACVLLALALVCAGAAACLAPMPAWAEVEAGAEAGSARDVESGLGVSGFARYQRGAARPVAGEDIGYRFPLPEGANLVALSTPERVLVYVAPEAAESLELDLADPACAQAVFELVATLDDEASHGGGRMSDEAGSKSLVVTSDPSVTVGAYTYIFYIEAGGRAYCAVQPAGLTAGAAPTEAAEAMGLDLGEGAGWCDGGTLVSAEDVAPAVEPGPFDRFLSFISHVDLSPLWVSLKTSFTALAITFVLGLLAAWRTMGTSSRLKGLLDSVFTIPMVLPPTVCGFLLLLLFGQATPVGRWLVAHGVSLVFTWEAAVISAVVVSFPLMYRTALGAFESLDAAMLDAARTLGWSEGRIFRRLMMPLAWPSIAAGTVLAFARAMGEFGCTLFFAGNYAGVTQTIPIAIYFEWMSGNTDVAIFWVVVVIALSFAVVLLINLYTARSQRYRMRGGIARGRVRRRAPGVVASEGDRGGVVGADEDAEAGGDVLRIDREALRELLGEPAGGSGAGRHAADDASAHPKGGR